MAQTKGVGFTNVRDFTIDRYGADAWRAILGSFPAPDREVLDSVIVVGWYDLGLYARLIRAVDARFGSADLKLCHAIGRFEAERDLTTVQRMFLKLFRPSIALEQTGKYWRRFHDTGEWSIQRRGDREVLGELVDWGVVDAALCRELVGYMGRTLELLGGRDVTMEHPSCRVDGAPTCQFRAQWFVKRDAPAGERAALEEQEGELRTPSVAARPSASSKRSC